MPIVVREGHQFIFPFATIWCMKTTSGVRTEMVISEESDLDRVDRVATAIAILVEEGLTPLCDDPYAEDVQR